MKNYASGLLAALFLCASMTVSAEDSVPTIEDLRARFDVANFQLTDKAQVEAFEQLVEDSATFTAANPEVAEGWIWSGIIKSSFAGAKGGLGALGLAKKARVDFEAAMEIDADAMQGSSYTSLGTLYYSVPGWPLGFGNDDKAEELLLKGLALNKDGIVSNFFYAEFLRDQGRDAEAIDYYTKADKAPLRPGREIADAGRRKKIQAALDELNS